MKYIKILLLTVGLSFIPYAFAQNNTISVTITPDSHIKWTLVCPTGYSVTVNSEDGTLVCTNSHIKWSVAKDPSLHTKITGTGSMAPDSHIKWNPVVAIGCSDGLTATVIDGKLVCKKM